MFGNLFVEAENVAARSTNLQAKIDKLAVRVTQLDSTVEEGMGITLSTRNYSTKNRGDLKKTLITCLISVSLQDIQLRKAFRSSQAFDQQVVSRESMPKAMLEAYMACDQPPPLSKLNPYRYTILDTCN